MWLKKVVEAYDSLLNVIPIQCLCVFVYLNLQREYESDADKLVNF